jgi:hypothetical protein
VLRQLSLTSLALDLKIKLITLVDQCGSTAAHVPSSLPLFIWSGEQYFSPNNKQCVCFKKLVRSN